MFDCHYQPVQCHWFKHLKCFHNNRANCRLTERFRVVWSSHIGAQSDQKSEMAVWPILHWGIRKWNTNKYRRTRTCRLREALRNTTLIKSVKKDIFGKTKSSNWLRSDITLHWLYILDNNLLWVWRSNKFSFPLWPIPKDIQPHSAVLNNFTAIFW